MQKQHKLIYLTFPYNLIYASQPALWPIENKHKPTEVQV
jgi:hypothetical protein